MHQVKNKLIIAKFKIMVYINQYMKKLIKL